MQAVNISRIQQQENRQILVQWENEQRIARIKADHDNILASTKAAYKSQSQAELAIHQHDIAVAKSAHAADIVLLQALLSVGRAAHRAAHKASEFAGQAIHAVELAVEK